jgi:hypothetical protein
MRRKRNILVAVLLVVAASVLAFQLIACVRHRPSEEEVSRALRNNDVTLVRKLLADRAYYGRTVSLAIRGYDPRAEREKTLPRPTMKMETRYCPS